MPEFTVPEQCLEGANVVADNPLVAWMDNVITPEEAAHIIALADGQLKRAKVSLDDESVITKGRSGSNCWIRYDEDDIVLAVGQRIADMVGMPLSHAESLQIIHYGVSQEYRAHFDAYDLSTIRGQRCCRNGGQRMLTALVYLNDIEKGGGTGFPRLGVEVEPKPGRMTVFHNTADSILEPHPGSLHAGLPVEAGEKWAFNMWFHARPMTEIQDFSTYDGIEGEPVSMHESHIEIEPETIEHSDDISPHPGLRTRINRASAIWRPVINDMNSGQFSEQKPVCFSYWDTYGNNHPDYGGLPAGTRTIRLIDRQIAKPIGHKGLLPGLLAEKDLSHLVPPTYMTVADALADPSPPKVWFIKGMFSTGGKDMQCVSHADLASYDQPEKTIIQAGVGDLELMDGHKFTARIYVMLWDGDIWLYRDGFTMRHGKPWVEDSTDYAVQIDHRGYTKDDAPVTSAPLSAWTGVEGFRPGFRKLLSDLRPALKDCLDATDRDHYLLLGIDLLLQKGGGIRMLEMNIAANFVHSRRVNEDVNMPFFRAILTTMLGGSDDMLEKIE